MKLPPFLFPVDQDRTLKGHLTSLVMGKGTEGFAMSFTASIFEWKEEDDRRMRRLKWCLSHLHTREEIFDMVVEKLRQYDLHDVPTQPMRFYFGRSFEQEADSCDMIIYGRLNLSYGERFCTDHYDSVEDAVRAGQGLGHELWEVYGSGDGGADLVYDADGR